MLYALGSFGNGWEPAENEYFSVVVAVLPLLLPPLLQLTSLLPFLQYPDIVAAFPSLHHVSLTILLAAVVATLPMLSPLVSATLPPPWPLLLSSQLPLLPYYPCPCHNDRQRHETLLLLLCYPCSIHPHGHHCCHCVFHARGLITRPKLGQSTPGIFILVISGILFCFALTLFYSFTLWFSVKVS